MAPNHGYGAVELTAAGLLPEALPGALILVGGAVGLALAVRRRSIPISVALVLLLGPALLISNLVVLVPNDLPERVLYPSTMAAAGLIAAALFRWTRRGVVRNAVIGVVLAVFAVQCYRAQRPWHSEETLWAHGLAVEPKSITAREAVAQAEFARGDLDEAIWHQLVAAYVYNSFPGPLPWVGIEALEQLPAGERWREAPRVLGGEGGTCPFVFGTLAVLRRRLPSIEGMVVEDYRRRYRKCLDGK